MLVEFGPSVTRFLDVDTGAKGLQPLEIRLLSISRLERLFILPAMTTLV